MTTPASEIDVSPMIFTEFVLGDRRFRTDEPLVFEVSYMEESEMYLIEGEYHTILWGETREIAYDVLLDHFECAWRDFAEGDPAGLDGVAADFGVELRRRFKLVPDAP